MKVTLNKPEFIEYIEAEIKNTNKLQCNDCQEVEKKLFKACRIDKDFSDKLDKLVFYFCEHCAKLRFPYFFKAKAKAKNQLSLFEVEI